MQFETATTIDRPIDEVFAYVMDVSNLPDWATEVVEVKHDSDIRLGATGADIRKMGGKTIEMPWTVTVFDPPRSAVFEYTVPFPGTAAFEFEATADGGTLMRCATTVSPKGKWRLMAPLMLAEARRTDREQFARVKEILERR